MLSVDSEIGRLRKALVHEPGPEVDRMVPAMMEQLLFDDILYGDRARDEHARFRRVLQLFGIELYDAADLLRESLDVAGARDWLIDVAHEDLAGEIKRQLRGLTTAELTELLVCGKRRQAKAPGREAEDLYSIPPLPNWCFQRDTQVVLGNGVVFCSMGAPARYREAMLARTIFRHHPILRETPVVCDPLVPDPNRPPFIGPQQPHLEGGDLLLLSPEVMAVGLSERTNRAGIKRLARSLSGRAGMPRWLVVVSIPRRRAYMHLDTLITAVDRDACLVYPPVILPGGPEEAQVFEIDLHAADPEFASRGPLLATLARRGLSLEPIPCGGEDPVTQQREQWTDGANALALAPGVITLFDRNLATAEQLSRHGFQIVEAEDLLLGREEARLEGAGRTCILIRSHEISRARGGPHCLLHPLVREAA